MGQEKYEPTEEEINKVMEEVAAQFGEKFEAADPAVSEGNIVEEYKKEGWNLVDVITNAAKVSIGEKEGKEIKVVGLGSKFLVFEKDTEKDEEE